ncbi:MAG TPA: hypothetical protein VFV38_13640 [Ktedonobacteraceae bacterium]|nr:hypothetical protein [Ktedonobacteraceae bacterium]
MAEVKPLGGTVFYRRETVPGRALTLWAEPGSRKIELSEQQAWNLFVVLLQDIERLAATQPRETLNDDVSSALWLLATHLCMRPPVAHPISQDMH